MSLAMNWLGRAHSCGRSVNSLRHTARLGIARPRPYATHRDAFAGRPSDLSQSLDTTRSRGQPRDNAGPFPLGVSQSFNGEKVKKWSELSVGGKVKRTTARTSNLTVVLLGAGMSLVLIYCLTTELFSSNSPTVLHNEACERIRKSPQIAKYLHGPLTFHNSPTSVDRPRSRMGSHQIASEVMIDQAGRSHMFLSFYVQGQLPGASSSDSYYEAVVTWLEDKASRLPEMTVDGTTTWAKEQSERLSQQFRHVFKYLIGAPVAPTQTASTPTHIEEQKEESKAWQVAGIFSSLRRTKGNPEPPEGQVFTDGEVHAELVMNSDERYQFRYLFVDIPNSKDPRRNRVFVERMRGVGEDPPILRR